MKPPNPDLADETPVSLIWLCEQQQTVHEMDCLFEPPGRKRRLRALKSREFRPSERAPILQFSSDTAIQGNA